MPPATQPLVGTPLNEPPRTETKPPIEGQNACPPSPQPPACGENQGVIPRFDANKCISGYDCKEIPKATGGEGSVCPQIPPPSISCQPNERLNKATDDKGCVIGFNCVSSSATSATTTPQSQQCPAAPEKPACQGSVAPVFDRGCLISYTCVPEGCRQETDASGFVRVICSQEKVCPAGDQQKQLVDNCKAQGGNPLASHDANGCTFYDCRFDNRESNPNPISGHRSCPTPEKINEEGTLCRQSGLNPGISYEGGCKVVRCSQESGPRCEYIPESQKARIESECSAKGLPTVNWVDNKGCALYRCGGEEGSEFSSCQKNIPSEAYKACNGKGGEMIVKNDAQGCIVFSQCVAPGNKNDAYVSQVEEVPDTTVLLSLALKLEKLKIELQKLASESKEIAKFYGSSGSLDEERYTRVSSMFSDAAERVDEIKIKIRGSAETITPDDLTEIKHDIKYIKDVTLKDILYLMLSNSDDVKETLEASRNINVNERSIEKLEASVKSCATDGSCFDKAIRSCKPVSFQPEGRNGPSLTIKGIKDGACLLHVVMQSENMIPPGFTKDEFYMECAIKNYALGVRGPEDIIPNCEGPMAKFAKQFGGGAQISGGDDEFQNILETEGGPGGCTNEKECATYCIDNYEECRSWVKEHPAVGSMPSREELQDIASGKGQQLERRQGQQSGGFAGPGGCKGPQECDNFCRDNPEECTEWCEENPDICKGAPPQSIPQQGGPGEFGSRAASGSQPQEFGGQGSRSSGSAQACVGCLNNGVCDIGECSECGDCRSGTGFTGPSSNIRQGPQQGFNQPQQQESNRQPQGNQPGFQEEFRPPQQTNQPPQGSSPQAQPVPQTNLPQ